MAKYSLSIDRENCISDAICTALCSNWKMDEGGKASFVKGTIGDEEYECNREAEISCPTGVIRIKRIAD
jgi:ferredoxin